MRNGFSSLVFDGRELKAEMASPTVSFIVLLFVAESMTKQLNTVRKKRGALCGVSLAVSLSTRM